MAKEMVLKDLLAHIDFTEKVILKEGENVIFKGSVLNVPWIYADFILNTDDNGEALYIADYGKNNESAFLIYIKEKPEA